VLKATKGEANLTADAIGALAQKLSDKVGVDDEAIQSGENLLLTFRNVKNEAGAGNDIFNQATSAILDVSAAMGQDLIDLISEFEQSVCIELLEPFCLPFHSTLRIAGPQTAFHRKN